MIPKEINMARKMSEQISEKDDHRMEDDLLEQIMTALESAAGHKYVGYFPEQSATRIKRIEPDNSALLELYNNDPKARELIDAFVNSAPYDLDLVIKLGLPGRSKG
jgi:hypothetical protein